MQMSEITDGHCSGICSVFAVQLIEMIAHSLRVCITADVSTNGRL